MKSTRPQEHVNMLISGCGRGDVHGHGEHVSDRHVNVRDIKYEDGCTIDEQSEGCDQNCLIKSNVDRVE